jgi:hypothetical protein
VLLERCQIPLEDVPAALLIGEASLDTPERLGNRQVLLVQALQSPVDLVEVTEHLTEALIHLLLHRDEPTVDLAEPVVDLAKPAVHLVEPPVHLVEPPVHLAELATQVLDELLVFLAGHGRCLSQASALFKCLPT